MCIAAHQSMQHCKGMQCPTIKDILDLHARLTKLGLNHLLMRDIHRGHESRLDRLSVSECRLHTVSLTQWVCLQELWQATSCHPEQQQEKRLTCRCLLPCQQGDCPWSSRTFLTCTPIPSASPSMPASHTGPRCPLLPQACSAHSHL